MSSATSVSSTFPLLMAACTMLNDMSALSVMLTEGKRPEER